ncbi:MAG TPA: NADH:flavin oxidoreductase/NADH oxidase, partial [bacterium]|nr:NADH:flavin oxidoreductase/NADH oxidase [bacterium]
TLRGLTLPNRIVISPMCQYSARDGCASDWHVIHLGHLSLSGAALLIVEATGVESRGRISPGCLGLYSAENEAALARVLAACRAWGNTRLGIQLAHAGRKASARVPWEGGGPLGAEESPWQTVAPSALPFGPGWPVPQALDEQGLAAVRDAFVQAAQRAARVGLDLVELHMAHGYLLHEFLSPLSNRRQDAYGGSLENRMRFPLEVAAAVRQAWPAERPLGARITGSDWLPGGVTPEEATLLAQRLAQVGCDYVCVSSGGITAEAQPRVGPGYQVPFAAQVRAGAGLPVWAVGMIADPHQANAIVTSGQADMVALARGILDNPRWPWHAAQALGAQVEYPRQYLRSHPSKWPGAALARPAASGIHAK